MREEGRKGMREEGRKGTREEGRKGMREEGRKGTREEGRKGGKAVRGCHDLPQLMTRPHHCTLYLCSPNPVPLHVDDVIHAPCDLVVTVNVTTSTVPGEVVSRKRSEVGFHEPVMVTADGAGHAGGGATDAQVTLSLLGQQLLALEVGGEGRGGEGSLCHTP